MPNRPLLLGHRGARSEKSIPENTPAAFDFALAQSCDGFECDVRLSADGEAAICHDASIHALEIAQSSAQRLAVPVLREILTRYQNSAFLDIELKVPGLERITLDLLRHHPPVRGYVVSSFLPAVLEAIHGVDVAIPLGLICETQTEFSLWPKLPVQYVIPHHKLVRKGVYEEIKAAGRKIFVWTVNSAVEMQRFAGWGVDGIISDDPEQLALTLGRIPKAEFKK
jgi:glycerophosphoryl diester phosphodiesterase